MITTVYVTQYGFWWKLTPEQWQAMLEAGVRGEGYELPRSQMMARRSPLIFVTDYGGDSRPSFHPMRDDIRVYAPLDWEESQFEEALEDFKLAQKA